MSNQKRTQEPTKWPRKAESQQKKDFKKSIKNYKKVVDKHKQKAYTYYR